MRNISIVGLAMFPLIAHASDPTGLIPYAVGFFFILCISAYAFTWLATKSMPNNWKRFYIRVLSMPVALSVVFLAFGLGYASIFIMLAAALYIFLYKVFIRWLRK